MIEKVLVANRGEIAIRVMETCREMDIPTVAVYSDADKNALHARYADESVHIGESASSKSYLVMEKIIDAAKKTGANAIHPGYGFLSENATFAELCKDNDITFIGPPSNAINLMGDKTEARTLMESHNIPLPPGSTKALEDIEEAKKIAEEIGFPVLVKAAAGGGGKGMRIIYKPDEFESGIRGAKSEAKNAFGDDRVYVEKYLEEPHHIEIQIIADQHGNVIHLYDRECSIQRRHQKVVEEAPSPFVNDELREKIASTAIQSAKACGYYSAGTVEFLVDKNRNHYFLEMNTRLQVEHPVTELVTGVDLVKLQIMVANGDELPFKQDDIQLRGHAIESRISAEDPADQFLPSTGKITHFRQPQGAGVRLDTGVQEGSEVSINYDPMIAKLVTYGEDRPKAIARMKRALQTFELSGIETTIPFCDYVMKHESFVSGVYDTHFVKDHFDPKKLGWKSNTEKESTAPVIAALIREIAESKKNTSAVGTAKVESGGGRFTGTWWQKRRN
jgi:propionyl-CoA carboxylase alpha chain